MAGKNNEKMSRENAGKTQITAECCFHRSRKVQETFLLYFSYCRYQRAAF